MTAASLLTVLKPALAEMFGTGWTVSVSDDEWTALQYLGEQPDGVRAVMQVTDYVPNSPELRGLAGTLTGKITVQIPRGLGRDELDAAVKLLNAEEKARRALLAIVFQMPGDPDWPADWTEPQTPTHPEIGRFVLTGAGPYRPPDPSILLQHPAREVRWALPFAFREPNNVKRINLALSSGN